MSECPNCERLRARLAGIPEHWIALDGENGEPHDPAYIRRPDASDSRDALRWRTLMKVCSSIGLVEDAEYYTQYVDAAIEREQGEKT